MTTRLPAAVLWDMDGTLVDTEQYWMAAETELMEAFGLPWSHDDALELVGSGLWDGAAYFQAKGVDLDADTIVNRLTERVREQLEEHGVPWRPGARELLQALREASVPTALVTMSVRSMADDIVAAIPFEAFDLIVSGDSVENAKPHPEPYLTAATQLGVDIVDCVAIEDSPTGLASAHASGAIALAVPNFIPLDGLPAAALWPTLDGTTVDDVAALLTIREVTA
ncbi:HAD family hydrolase [Agromyces cerinus]|uniref:Haloacid dehalogenase superfamily, subfamily IA, variant 3 with third motif having DD or ED n=1 Tax=Agromyces cerinus subsp. cerinus TaxID=232089 RepID=A0A1N6DYU3_9MICO|nr:HAD family phosphatase [Agromyces cerinus]SIN75950.1 haloacid dehalogenase superfamily, subfamily IA, variant 3 with third motif having DD or ED [Agromyces cerinus subsp. cerinus]